MLHLNPADIGCKDKRLEILGRREKELKKLKKRERKERVEEHKQTGQAKLQTITTDDKREVSLRKEESFLMISYVLT